MYGIKKHIKGDKYSNDCLMLDNNYKVRAVTKDTAEMLVKYFEKRYGDAYSFRIVRLD